MPNFDGFAPGIDAVSPAQPQSAKAEDVVNPDRPVASGAHRFLVLDGLRGLAAFAVILDHVISRTLAGLLPGRYLAVDFFFVLSGFVLAHAYGSRLSKGWSPFAFMRVRLIRLYPLYLLGLILGVSIAALSAVHGWSSTPISEILAVLAFGLFFLPAPPIFAWTSGQLYPFVGPAWSLFFELIANLVYGLVARFLTLRVLAILLPFAAIAVVVTVLNHSGVGGPGWLWPHFDAGISRVLFGFFAGVAIYQLRSVVQLPAMPAWAAAVVFIAIVAAPIPAEWRAIYDATAAIIFMPLLVTFASGAKVSGRAAAIAGRLGQLSYGVYVLHMPIMVWMFAVLNALHITLPYGFMAVALVALMAGLAAALADRFYDGPVRRLLNRKANGVEKAASASEIG